MWTFTRQVIFEKREIDGLSVAMSGRLVQAICHEYKHGPQKPLDCERTTPHKIGGGKVLGSKQHWREVKYSFEVNMNNWPKYHHTISMNPKSYMTDEWRVIVCWSLAADIVFGLPMPSPQYRTLAQSTLLNGGWWVNGWAHSLNIIFPNMCVCRSDITLHVSRSTNDQYWR